MKWEKRWSRESERTQHNQAEVSSSLLLFFLRAHSEVRIPNDTVYTQQLPPRDENKMVPLKQYVH